MADFNLAISGIVFRPVLYNYHMNKEFATGVSLQNLYVHYTYAGVRRFSYMLYMPLFALLNLLTAKKKKRKKKSMLAF